MPARLLKVDDLRDLTSPDKVAKIFEQLGYNASSEPIDVEGLQLSARSAEAIAALVKLEKQYFDVNSEARQGLRLEILEAEKQVFAGAIAYPSIIVVKKQKVPLTKGDVGGSHQASVLTWQEGQSLEDFVAVYQKNRFSLKQTELKPDGWRLESPEVLRLLDKLRNAGTPLGEYVNGCFCYGIKTGFNEAFVVDRETRDRLIAEHPSSAEVLKPYCRGKDVKRWYVEDPDLWLLSIPWHFPIHETYSGKGVSDTSEALFRERYPAVYNHLLSFKEPLSARNKAETGIRYEWYAIQRCTSNYWKEFQEPKIILGRFMDKAKFAFDKNHIHHNDALYMIAGAEEYVAGVLNSSVSWWFLSQICTDLQNGYLQAYKENLEHIPIPKASEEEKKAIEELVEKCLAAKGVGVEAWEAEIDERVARLYGLTPTEINLIKGEK